MTPEELSAPVSESRSYQDAPRSEHASPRFEIAPPQPKIAPLPARGTRNGWPTTMALVLADGLAIATGLLLAALVVAWGRNAWGWPSVTSIRLATGYMGAMFLGLQAQGLYRGLQMRPAAELRVMCL